MFLILFVMVFLLGEKKDQENDPMSPRELRMERHGRRTAIGDPNTGRRYRSAITSVMGARFQSGGAAGANVPSKELLRGQSRVSDITYSRFSSKHGRFSFKCADRTRESGMVGGVWLCL